MASEIARELKRGTLEMILLKLLSGGPMYGYQLVSTLERRSDHRFELKEGTLYPVLYRLEEAKLIEARWETQERGVPRKYYELTPLGVARLQSLIAAWHSFVATVNQVMQSGEDMK